MCEETIPIPCDSDCCVCGGSFIPAESLEECGQIRALLNQEHLSSVNNPNSKAMTNEELREIEERHSKITPGGWTWRHDEWWGEELIEVITDVKLEADVLRIVTIYGGGDKGFDQDIINVKFIAHAPTDISALLAGYHELKAEVERLKEANHSLRQIPQTKQLDPSPFDGDV